MSDTAKVKIMLVDDHEVVRAGLRTLLERRPGFAIVSEAGDGNEAVDVALQSKPDVIVMDIRLPTMSGIEACRAIRDERPETKVIMLTSYADDEAVYGSIMAGAAGYLLKQTRGQDLAGAIERVARGESLLDPSVTEKVLARMRSLAEGETTSCRRSHPQERKILAASPRARRTKRSPRRSSSATRR